MATIRLADIAYARSGDKGAGSNVGVIARSPRDYETLRQHLTANKVEAFFAPLNPGHVTRYELQNLLALNFVLPNVLDGGASVSLRIDAQGKALGQAILEMTIDVPEPRIQTSELLVDTADPAITILTLNRPEKRNALSLSLIQQLYQAVQDTSQDRACRAIIFRASGPAFCAGLDLHEAATKDGPESSAKSLARLYSAIVQSPLIAIAAAHGAAIGGGGAGLLAACDFVVASEDLQISFPEVRRGLVPALVACLLQRQISQRAMRELFLLAGTIDARRAIDIGLVNWVVSQQQLDHESVEIARQTCLGAPGAIAQTKKLLHEITSRPIDEELNRVLAYHQRHELSAETDEGIAAFKEKRAAALAAAQSLKRQTNRVQQAYHLKRTQHALR